MFFSGSGQELTFWPTAKHFVFHWLFFITVYSCAVELSLMYTHLGVLIRLLKWWVWFIGITIYVNIHFYGYKAFWINVLVIFTQDTEMYLNVIWIF